MHDGAPALSGRAVRVDHKNAYHKLLLGRGRFIAWPPRPPDLNPLNVYLWEHLQPLVYAAPVDNEETLHHRTVDACQTVYASPGIFEWLRRSMMRRVEVCVESDGDILSIY
jgi:hypothetical protein